jgi:hypothetical protein
MSNVLRRLAAPVAAVVALVGLAAAPASAAQDPDGASLTGALLALYAEQAGQTLDGYLAANDLMVSTSSGVATLLAGADVAADPQAQRLSASTLPELDDQLAERGLTLDLRSYATLTDLAADVIAKSHTADGAVTLAGAQWTAQLAALRSPDLTAPSVGQPGMPTIPQEALAFGLLLDQSIARTVLQAPDLFAAAGRSGVGSDALATVFSDQMLSAWQDSAASLTSVLPNQCTGAMLAVMASGDPGAAQGFGQCNPACVTGGLYLNAQTSFLFGARSNLMSGRTNQLWTYETMLAAQSWRAQDLLEQNPQLVQALLAENGTAGGAMACAEASKGSQAALTQALPGIFSQLRVAD